MVSNVDSDSGQQGRAPHFRSVQRHARVVSRPLSTQPGRLVCKSVWFRSNEDVDPFTQRRTRPAATTGTELRQLDQLRKLRR